MDDILAKMRMDLEAAGLSAEKYLGQGSDKKPYAQIMWCSRCAAHTDQLYYYDEEIKWVCQKCLGVIKGYVIGRDNAPLAKEAP